MNIEIENIKKYLIGIAVVGIAIVNIHFMVAYAFKQPLAYFLLVPFVVVVILGMNLLHTTPADNTNKTIRRPNGGKESVGITMSIIKDKIKEIIGRITATLIGCFLFYFALSIVIGLLMWFIFDVWLFPV